MQRALILASFCMILGFSACQKDKPSGLFNGPVEPAISGQWTGAIQMSLSTPSLQMTIEQTNLYINGAYSTSVLHQDAMGRSGHVSGITTGNTFLLELYPADQQCHAYLKLTGYNDGQELAFDYAGVDCSSSPVSGQGYFQRPS